MANITIDQFGIEVVETLDPGALIPVMQDGVSGHVAVELLPVSDSTQELVDAISVPMTVATAVARKTTATYTAMIPSVVPFVGMRVVDGTYPNVEWTLVDLPVTSDDSWSGKPTTNPTGQLVGPIINGHDTAAVIATEIIALGAIKSITDEPGALTVGDGTTLGGNRTVSAKLKTLNALTLVANDITYATAAATFAKTPSTAMGRLGFAPQFGKLSSSSTRSNSTLTVEVTLSLAFTVGAICRVSGFFSFADGAEIANAKLQIPGFSGMASFSTEDAPEDMRSMTGLTNSTDLSGLGWTANLGLIAFSDALVTVPASGKVELKWAQIVTDGDNDVSLSSGSYLIATQIA